MLHPGNNTWMSYVEMYMMVRVGLVDGVIIYKYDSSKSHMHIAHTLHIHMHIQQAQREDVNRIGDLPDYGQT